MKGEVLQFMAEFHSQGKIVSGLNSSFITLIPKREEPCELSDFRPISLVNSVYKILAKVLSKRLKRVLPEIISEAQTAFLGGRSILDGVLIANEVVHWWKAAKMRGIILKLDFEKAYDSVNWEFLLSMMRNFGFGEKWLGWIKSCLSSSRVSVLVNGSPTKEFAPQRGLRQGDPLSPLLFNIVAEGLNILIERAKELGLVKGASVGPTELKFSHLQFADDSIIFCEAVRGELVHIKRILRCFEVLSGLKINFHKSLLCGVGVPDGEVNQFTSIFNCRSQKLPFNYLGLPLGANPNRKSTWQPVIEKVKKKLANWKRKFLSYAGRLTLIRSVLSCMPIYFLSIFKIPVGVAKQIEKIQTAFLWGKSELKRKVHLVKWADLTVDKSQGGLGLRNLREVNACLLLKWWWRFGVEDRAIWKQVVRCKYGLGAGGWVPSIPETSSVSRIWSDVVHLGASSPELMEYYLSNFKILVGNGHHILFWEDKWLNNLCLKAEFPRLYRLSVEKGCSLVQMHHNRGSALEWKFLFSRVLFAWEEEEVARLQEVLRGTLVLTDQAEDSCLWMANPSGSYSAGVSWKWWMLSKGPVISVADMLWKNSAPPKVKFCSWLAWKERLKTSVFLKRIGVLNSEANTVCLLCKTEEESLNHLLLSCPVVWKLWSDMVKWWDLVWVVPGTVEGLLHWWAGYKFKKEIQPLWKVVPVAVVWSIWKARNDCLFHQKSVEGFDLAELVKVRIAFWCKHSRGVYGFNVHGLIVNGLNAHQAVECLSGFCGNIFYFSFLLLVPHQQALGASCMDTQQDGYFTNLLQERPNIDEHYLMESQYLNQSTQVFAQESQFTTEIESLSKKPQRGGNFTIEEDKLLVSA
ncbi:uncharacterized protein LOC114303962 [Camellia sinensis]|uniref:uncharacterized protein LOC114303962 n=1 Tax=Camellia sinensis TaxID=4442 RepID=UPI00103596B1|nr:uncharacterized protein LOC114303962 [Camellia sinensis]